MRFISYITVAALSFTVSTTEAQQHGESNSSPLAACPNPVCPICETTVCPECPPPPQCSCVIKTCASDLVLINADKPTCECVKNPCEKLGGIQRITVRNFHPTVEPDKFANSMWAFLDATNGKHFTDLGSLQSQSKCLANIATSCSNNFGFPGFQLSLKSYRWVSKEILNADPEVHTYWMSPEAKPLRAWLGNKNTFLDYLITRSIASIDSCIKSHIQNAYNPSQVARETGWDPKAGIGATGEIFRQEALMYEDCRPVPEEIQTIWRTGKCSAKSDITFNEYTSPISLIWSEHVDIQSVISRSRFPLNPSEKGRWFIWRGSGFTPLLVLRKDASGTITEASQLFGNHTWGKSWKHGYEALASLDTDKNQWLEGAELSDIALWFDFNQDGISDSGEVRPLAAVGVTALGVTVSRTDEKSGFVRADKGFRRTVLTSKGSETIEGASVDWFSSALEGVYGKEALYNSSVDGNTSNSNSIFSEAETLAKHPSLNLVGQVAGIWQWYAVDPNGNELPNNLPGGAFTLFASSEGIRGTLFNSQRFAPNTLAIGEAIALGAFAGSIRKNDAGIIEISFESNNTAKGKAITSARLTKDGEYLVGTTREAASKDGQEYQYGWRARRAILQ